MKTYIAGPMTGYPNFNWDRFYETESILENIGIHTANPARITDIMGGQNAFVSDDAVRTAVLAEERRVITEECDSIYLLNGWENSAGTLIELELARKNGLSVITESEF